MGKPIFRFAPSPNGYLHLGHALSALINRQMADEASGALFLRVDDIDLTRARPEFEAAIVEDLTWLGMEFDGEIRRQSDNIEDYRSAPDVLRVCLRMVCRYCCGVLPALDVDQGKPWPDGRT